MPNLEKDVIKEVDEALLLLDSQAFLGTNYKGGNASLLLNNSFVERKGITTTKSARYLRLPIASGPPVTVDPKTVEVIVPTKNINLPQALNFDSVAAMPIAQAMRAGRKELGKLVLVLIGVLNKTLVCEKKIASSILTRLRYDPSASQDYSVDLTTKIVTTRNLGDLGGLHAAATTHVPGGASNALREALAVALKEVEQDAVVRVLPPARSSATLPRTLLGELAATLDAERREYDRALASHKKRATPQGHNDLLRIAYNFASDATKIIHLLICIADLKPAILWLTLATHVRLAKAFQALPWQSQAQKPSLENYQQLISNARNRAFHNLFAFNRTLDVDVSKVTLQALELRLFEPYAGRTAKASGLKYKDQELVDALSNFTRAPERTLDDTFLTANSIVMKETQLLAQNTAHALLRLSK